MKQWYEILFENYAHSYDREVFTQGTVQEVDFIEREIDFDRTKKILDVGCGTGRHALELAKRGYAVTGVDLSASQLQRAREKAADAHVQVRFEQLDARSLPYIKEYDVVLNLCEAGFALMETDDMNFAILQGEARALKPGGKFFLTTLNALFPLAHSIEEFINSNTVETKSSNHVFDFVTLRDRSLVEIADDAGNIRTLQCNERYYMPSEISWMLTMLHCSTIEIFGCKVGNFSRNRPVTPNDYEMLVVATIDLKT
jgi:2-polyprenyl-3-methyl-5-hydroxy-6-metoxy-1,4-benzoquinol methylase